MRIWKPKEDEQDELEIGCGATRLSRCFRPQSSFLLVCFLNCFYCLPFENLEAEKEKEEDEESVVESGGVADASVLSLHFC